MMMPSDFIVVPRLHATLTMVATLLAMNACKQAPDQNVDQSMTGGTDGIASSGPVVCENETEAADETGDDGGGPPFCLDKQSSIKSGIRHQCGGEYDLTVSFTIDPGTQSSYTVPLFNNVMPGNESSYEDPFVSVCCSDVTEAPGWCPGGADTCDTVHQRFCYSALVAHICYGVGPWLRTYAIQNDGFNDLPGLVREGGDWAAGDGRQECYDHFWNDPPDEFYEEDFCVAGYDGFFQHTPWEPNKSWSGLVGEVRDLKVELRTKAGPTFVIPPPTSGAEECSAAPSGADGIPPFPESSPPFGAWLTTLDPIPVDAIGPEWNGQQIAGLGLFSTDSLIRAATVEDDLVIFNWSMVSDGPTTIGTSTAIADVGKFKVELIGQIVAPPRGGGTYFLDSGQAMFNLSADVNGVTSAVQATNATEMALTVVTGGVSACPSWASYCIHTEALTVEYEDPDDDVWELLVDEAWWPNPLSFAP